MQGNHAIRKTVLAHLCALDGLHHVHSLGDSPEDRVFVVEPGAGHGGNEELRAVGPWSGVGHGHGERAIVTKTAMELVLWHEQRSRRV